MMAKMANQNLGDLNGYLFESLERLDQEELTAEELKNEIERSRAVTGVAKTVIENARLVLDIQKTYDEKIDIDKPNVLEG